MGWFKPYSQQQVDLGLAIVRAGVGAIFIGHGAQKLFVYGFAGVAGAFAQMGVPFPELLGPFVALVEFLGGIALVVGLLTRLAALGLAANMLVAIGLVHAKAGLFLPNGYEFALSLLVGSTLLTLTGAGRISLDALLGGRARGPAAASADSGLAVRRAA